MRPLLNTAFILALLVAIAVPVRAGEVVYTSWGKAIDGYDAVAYFTEGKPVEGDSDFTHEWMGAKWYFASAANRDAFAADPSKYAPQYGGYCAWAVSQGYSAKIDPEAWKVVNGKLYLNYSKDIQAKWIAGGVDKLIAAGDGNWPGIRKKLEAE
jgi:YHS domain-containing protein